MTEKALAPLRIIVADDHPLVRMGISTHVARQPDLAVLAQAHDGDAALALTQVHMPDVLILDVSMPGLPAVEVVKRVRALPAAPQVLVLTAHDDVEYVVTLLRAGAKGYVLKDEEPQALVQAIRAVAQGKTWLSAQVTAAVVNYTVVEETRLDEPNLTVREVEVLKLLSEGRDNQEIGRLLFISERTVRYHLRNIYGKLGVQRRGAAIAWAVRQRLGDDDDHDR